MKQPLFIMLALAISGVTSKIQAQETIPTKKFVENEAMRKFRERNEQISARFKLNDEAKADQTKRWRRIAELINAIENYESPLMGLSRREIYSLKDFSSASQLKEAEKMAELSMVLNDLGYISDNAAIPILVTKLDFEDVFRRTSGIPSPLEVIPSISALRGFGRPILPTIILELTRRGRSQDFQSNAFYLIRDIVDYRNNLPTGQILNAYAMEFERRAKRLRLLATQPMPTSPMPTSPIPTSQIIANAPAAKTMTPKLSVGQLARVLELQDVVIGKTQPVTDEAKVVDAINELADLGYKDSIRLIIDKLDYEISPAPEGPITDAQLRAAPQGLLSPKITDAAMKAVPKLGQRALPELMDGICSAGRGQRFRTNALSLIVQITGNEDAARQALNTSALEIDDGTKLLYKMSAWASKRD